jgi:hypothetical protein
VHDVRVDDVSDPLVLQAGTSITLMLGDAQALTDDANARHAIGGAVVRGEKVIRRRAGDEFEEHFIRARSERAQVAGGTAWMVGVTLDGSDAGCRRLV